MTARLAQPGPWTVARVYQMFPRLQERRNNFGNQLSGGEQQIAGNRPRAHAQSEGAAAGRAHEGLAPIIVEELLRAIGTIYPRRRHLPPSSSSKNAQKILGWPTAL